MEKGDNEALCHSGLSSCQPGLALQPSNSWTRAFFRARGSRWPSFFESLPGQGARWAWQSGWAGRDWGADLWSPGSVDTMWEAEKGSDLACVSGAA